MSYTSVMEVIIHLNTYQIHDAYSEGNYKLRFSVFHQFQKKDEDKKLEEINKYATPYMIPKHEKYNKNDYSSGLESEIRDDQFYTDEFTVEFRYARKKKALNQMCVFRFDLPSYPQIWNQGLTMRAELLIMINPQSTSAKKYEIVDDCWAVIDCRDMYINECLENVHEFFEIAFNKTFFGTLNGMIYTNLFDFSFRPISVGYEVFNLHYAPEIQNCNSFNEFYGVVSKNDDGYLDYFHQKYVKKVKNSAENLRKFVKQFYKIFLESNYMSEDVEKDLQKLLDKSTISFSNDFEDYFTKNCDFDKYKIYMERLKSEGESQEEILMLVKCRYYEKTKFSQFINKSSEESVSSLIQDEMRLFSKSLLTTWFDLFQPFYYFNNKLVQIHREKYYKIKNQRVTQSLIGIEIEDKYLGLQIKTNVAKEHRTIAQKKRKNTFHENLYEFNPLRIEDLREKEKMKFYPIFFEEVFRRPADAETFDMDSDETQESRFGAGNKVKSIPKSVSHRNPGVNLVILCHGMGGTSLDMLNLKHYFSLKYPNNYYFCSKANEEDTMIDINLMGVKLAHEIIDYVNMYVRGGVENVKRMSFVGHSLGGLIIRSALSKLKKFKGVMGTYMTLCTPHLGVNKGENKLVEFGFNLWTNWKQFDCLKQMGMKDAEKDPLKSFLWKLSESEGLEWFDHVVLISSPQDSYSPWESSRIQAGKRVIRDVKHGGMVLQMIENILGRLKVEKLIRVDIDISFIKTSLDTMIGRAAHVAPLSDPVILDTISHRYGELL